MPGIVCGIMRRNHAKKDKKLDDIRFMAKVADCCLSDSSTKDEKVWETLQVS